MQSLILPHLSFPERKFRESSLNVDPGRLSLNLSWSNNACGSIRAPYPSPPMSGSPLEENPSELSGGSRDQRQSESGIATTNGVSGSITAPSTSVIGEPEGRHLQSAHEQGGGFTERRDMIHEPLLASRALAFGGELSASAETAYAPTGTAGLASAAKTRPLPPRTTRRTKAHVASACVNCKRKHLGCDSARPCRRCVVAGKADTCVDVTHKKRGRPPLKAEETPLRPYATSSEDPSASKDASQFSPSNRSHFHRRTSSREIRPITDLQLPQTRDPGNRMAGGGLGAASIPAQRWTPSIYPSPRTIIASPSLPQGLGQRPISAGSSQHSIAAQSPFIQSAGPATPVLSGRRSPGRAGGQALPSSFSHPLLPASSPRQYPQSYPPISPYLERSRTPPRPLMNETPSLTDFRGPYAEPGLRLPPIFPSSDRHPGPLPSDPRSHSYPAPWSARQWPEQRQERHVQSRSLEVIEPVARHPQSFRSIAGASHHVPRQSAVPTAAVQPYPSQMTQRTDPEELRRGSGSTDSGDRDRPTKRRRMTLDDIVND